MIERGGTIDERLYLYDLVIDDWDKYDESSEHIINFKKSDLPNMEGMIERHKARYFLPAFFCRPGMKVLDFPCGSGYGSEIIRSLGGEYYGKDIDAPTIEYCRRIYSLCL